MLATRTSKGADSSQIAPGSRILVRGEEWLVRRVDRSSTGHRVFTVSGLSHLVRDTDARFIEDIEDQITVVDPAETIPVADRSPFYRDTRLHIEALLRNTAPQGNGIQLGHRGAMDVLPYQLDPAAIALAQPRQRILIADAVGLGKTIECGVLLTELIERGRGRRILVLTVKSMLAQFQKELWARFSIPLVRLDSAGIQRVRRRVPTNHNPFHYFDRTIISIDTIKQDSEYRTHLENAWWDVIVIDEAHNVAARGGGGGSLRARVASLLASRSDSLILLSATPHDGKKDSFASIMNMLNPTAIKDPNAYGPGDIDGLFIRRFKKDIQGQVTAAFPQRAVHRHRVMASAAEEAAFEALHVLSFTEIDTVRRSGALLFKTSLEKSLFSSPAACRESIKERVRRTKAKEDAGRFASDIAQMETLDRALEAITPEHFSKYQHLLALLRGSGDDGFAWNPKDPAGRLVVFTERIATLRFLRERLVADLGLRDKQAAILHGGLSDMEQMNVVGAFGDPESPLRLLVASDVASEGINLHYQCARLIHFDVPWSLLTFQQRNGRIDRYGQEWQPHIHYLLTESAHPKIRGDLRILELLTAKDEQVQENIGDPSEFTGLHDETEEEAQVGRAMEEGQSAEEFEALLEAGAAKTDDPWLQQLLADLTPAPSEAAPVEELTEEMPSLYASDYDWARAALEFVASRNGATLQVEYLDDRREIHFTLPADLQARLRRSMPAEIRPEDGRWVLSADRNAVKADIDRCRGSQERWPVVQLLWEQHPALIWANDKVLGAFGRREAPVIFLPDRLDSGEVIVLVTGVIPNRKGHPLVQRWMGVTFASGTLAGVLDLPQVLARTGLGRDELPRIDKEVPFDHLQDLLPDAVKAVRTALSEARTANEEATRPELDRQLRHLQEFREARAVQLEMSVALEQVREGRIRRLDRLVDETRTWIRDTMVTEDNPSIQIVAFFTP